MLITFLSLMLLVTVILLIERSYKIHTLNKMLLVKNAELLNYKNKNEAFSLSISKAQHHATNLLIDPRTQLLSKEAFDSQYTHLLNQSKRFNNLFAVLMIDINQFARINETYSHEVGDQLLVEIGIRLKNTIRDVDILSRYEGDVFIVLLPNMIKPEVIVHAVERIVHSVNMPFEVKGNSIEFTLGVGIAVYPFDGEDKKTLIMHAMEALEKSKSSGRNVFQFYQEETQALGERELTIKSAIKSTDFLQDVVLDFKPYYNALNNQINCIEVVSLLNHPELGKVSFSELARISQYSSKMFELYEWMMKHAMEQLMKMKDPSIKKCRLIFRFDLKQFAAPQFAEKIIELVKKIDQNKNQIVLELLDESDHGNLEVYRKSISKLNESNIPLAIDVLVLGHFALNKLNHISFSYLKIDEKLVQDIAKRNESKIILERILSLVDNLKLETLTMGVDTEEQKRILESMGCALMQGHVFKELILD